MCVITLLKLYFISYKSVGFHSFVLTFQRFHKLLACCLHSQQRSEITINDKIICLEKNLSLEEGLSYGEEYPNT